MALSAPQTEVATFKEREFTTERFYIPTTTITQENYEFARSQRLRPDPSVDTAGRYRLGDGPLRLKDILEKIEPEEFRFNLPWLPPNAIKLLNKSKKGPHTEKEMITLMELIAERASEHFQLDVGKFVAITFHGRIVEVSDTRVDLLKKIQGRKYQEQIFVWRIGFKAFSGRL